MTLPNLHTEIYPEFTVFHSISPPLRSSQFSVHSPVGPEWAQKLSFQHHLELSFVVSSWGVINDLSFLKDVITVRNGLTWGISRALVNRSWSCLVWDSTRIHRSRNKVTSLAMSLQCSLILSGAKVDFSSERRGSFSGSVDSDLHPVLVPTERLPLSN